jgi:hypothetical protein
MNLAFWKPRLTQSKVIVIQRDPSRLRLHEWRSDPALVKQAGFIRTSEFRLALDVLRNEHPAFNVLADDASVSAQVTQQRRGEGYTMALANLEALAMYQPITPPLEATFEPEQEQ